MAPFKSEQIIALAEILKSAAQAEILPRFRNLSATDIRFKTSIHDVVTDADLAAEAMIEAELLKLFPHAVIIGEEAASKDPSLLDRISDAELAFLIDPVDGTRNFASGLPLFGSMLAVTVRGETVAGVIHDPICGDWVMTVRGEGAFRRSADGNEHRLAIAPAKPIAEMEGCVSLHHLPRHLRERVSSRMTQIAITSAYRCAAHEYRLLASGFCDFLVFGKLMPWDHAAGFLLHQEAGGYGARLDGSAYSPRSSEGALLCAADSETWRAFHTALFA